MRRHVMQTKFTHHDDMRQIIEELHSMRQYLNDLKTDIAVVKSQVVTMNKQIEENQSDLKNLKWNITAFVTPIAIAGGQIVSLLLGNKP